VQDHLAVRQRRDTARNLQRSTADRRVDLAAERQRDVASDTRRGGLPDGSRVADGVERGVAKVGIDHRSEQRRSVAIGAGARIVGVVGDHEGPVGAFSRFAAAIASASGVKAMVE
jgi:hypothetical protein